jgi:diguanylate cyclase (GGDEF)-like protein
MQIGKDFVILAVIRDITESKRTEREIKESRERYRSLFEHSPIPIWEEDFSGVRAHLDRLRASGIRDFRKYFEDHPEEVDRCTALVKVLDISQESLEFFKARSKEEILSNLPLIFDKESFDVVREEMTALAEGNYRFESEIPARTLTGDKRVLALRLSASPGFEESLARVLVSFIDITERKQMEEVITFQAYHDPLTGLPNRMLFMDHLSHELSEARRNRSKLAVFFLDLDRFKNINDTLGHAVGDLLLKEVAGRVKACIRETDIVARIGGDEFNILLPDVIHTEAAAIIAKKILSTFQETFVINGHELRVTASIGISIYPDDGDNADILLKNADIAMYSAKEQGRNNYQFYSSVMNIRILKRAALEDSLRKALERRELLVYYQPQLNIATRRVICAEALVRWQHPKLGLLNPMEFIPLAEETGLIVSIDEWVLRAACARNKAWQEAGYPPICVTVNLSARQFQQPDLVETISRTLQETGLDSRFLDIEITESTAMRSIEHTMSSLTRLTYMGVRSSLDDFGIGYSSLNYLKKLPIQRLKIDKALIGGITVDPSDQAIVSAVIAMGHHLRINVAAEGVETEDQLSFLSSSHCDEMQGYLFSEPLPAERFEKQVMARG